MLSCAGLHPCPPSIRERRDDPDVALRRIEDAKRSARRREWAIARRSYESDPAAWATSPGPGGEASLSEEPCPREFDPCIGNVGNYGVPPGYDRVTALFLEDPSLVPAGTTRRQIHIYYQKDPDPTYSLLPKCGTNKVPPCVLGIKHLRSGVWKFRVLINSDPRLLPR
jgi:hypothetical protein